MVRFVRRILRCERGGVILLELAVMGGLLIAPLLGGLQWSINVGGLQGAGQAVREATRYVAITGDEAGGRNKAEQIVLGSSMVVRDFNAATDVTFTTAGGYVTGTVTVKVPDLVPNLPRLLGGQANNTAYQSCGGGALCRVYMTQATFRREQ